MNLFTVPPFAAVLYNDNQIMIIPDVPSDPGWTKVKITYGKSNTLSIYKEKEEVAIIANRKLTPMIVGCNDFYIGWTNEKGELEQRALNVDTLSLFPS